ncbi:MAG: prolipoprotein diacylglyceryl transferase [Chromatiaceae bacterium]|nr:prolipoprotein diacylglyceryl transferase [Gammaproteobacteria bacterium]MCP5304796.1 prolipoprotein diacylglyceryl transferase [Chromatiaceae bacterium]MCP5314755.1 prolipoprotein diacylglyceryl transferase [Chromatiaceae bacterium]
MVYPDFDPVALQLGPVAIRWYGLMYLVGFAAAWWLGRRRARRVDSPVDVAQFDDLLFYAALGVILGGRIGYTLFYDFSNWLADPLQILRIWEGGMSFHGGLLGVLLAVALYARRIGRRFFSLTDFIAPLVPLGLFTGRLGNFINGELWGAPSDVPWAMQVPCVSHPGLCWDKLALAPGSLLSPPLHPTQLYEVALEGIALFAILWWFSARPRPTMAVSGLFLIGYGLFRFLVEFVRMPDAHLGYLAFGWVTMGQLLSAPMLLAGGVLIYLAYATQSRA